METPNSSPNLVVEHTNKKAVVAGILIILAIAILAIGLYIYKYQNPQPIQEIVLPQTQNTVAEIPQSSLGSEIYKKSANPINDTLPTTVAPTPNPIENAYNNPFE